MNTKSMALDYIKRAKRCFNECKSAFEEEDYPITIRRAQECVELSLKAILRSIAIEYPRDHDVSEALETAKEKFPAWFSAKIADFERISRDLSKKRVQLFTSMKPSSDQLRIFSAEMMQRRL